MLSSIKGRERRKRAWPLASGLLAATMVLAGSATALAAVAPASNSPEPAAVARPDAFKPATIAPSGPTVLPTAKPAPNRATAPRPGIVIPPDPGDPNPPTFPPGSSGWCFVNTGGDVLTTVAMVSAGGATTVMWDVSFPNGCQGRVTLIGPGFSSGESVGSSGSRTVTAPLQLGTASWHLGVVIPGQVLKSLDDASAAVIPPQQPAVGEARNSDGRMELLRVKPSGEISRRSQTTPGAGSLSNWFGFDGALRSLVTETNADGRVEVFGIDGGGVVWYRYQLVAGTGAWSEWKRGPRYESTDLVVGCPDGWCDKMIALAMVRGGDGRLNVFGATPSGQVWRMTQRLANNDETWSGWSRLSGTPMLTALTAETDGDGTIELVGLQSDGTIWQRWQSGNGWTEFVRIPGILNSVALARHGDGRLEIVGNDSGGTMYSQWQIAVNGRNSWAGWMSLGPAMLTSISAESNAAGGIDVFGVTPSGYWRRTHSAPNVSAWSAWSGLDENTSGLGSTVAAPAIEALQVTANSIGVLGHDQSTNEVGFQVQRRGSDGNWTVPLTVPTRNAAGTGGAAYSWVDMSDLSGQCYRFIAYTHDDLAGSGERCSVRPDPDHFPQQVSQVAQQWQGFAATNGASGHIHNTNQAQDLIYENRTTGVSLGWGTADAWTFEAQGGPTLMKGQALAMHLSGHGYLRYSVQTFGANLQFSDTPSYEWYVIGESGSEGTQAGQALPTFRSALWNSRAAAYLVKGHETWGIQLNWYTVGGSMPPPDQQPPPAPGIKHLVVYNCAGSPSFPDIDPIRPLSFWVRDATTGGAFTGGTHIVNNWLGQNCGSSGFSGQPFTYNPPITGHVYVIQAVDYTLPGCTDDPLNGGSNNCLPSTVAIVGDTNGLEWQTTVT